MGEVFVGNRAARLGKGGEGGLQIGRAPQYDRPQDDVDGAGPVGLRLETVIAKATDAVNEDGLLQGILGFALVQLPRGVATLFGAFDPVEPEQRASDLAQRQREAVGTGIGPQAFEERSAGKQVFVDRQEATLQRRSSQATRSPKADTQPADRRITPPMRMPQPASRHGPTVSRRISIPISAPTIIDISRIGATRLSGAPAVSAARTRM